MFAYTTWTLTKLGVVGKVLDSGREVSEFELQSRYYVHYRTNTLEKGMKPFIPRPAIGYMISLLFFFQDGFGIK